MTLRPLCARAEYLLPQPISRRSADRPEADQGTGCPRSRAVGTELLELLPLVPVMTQRVVPPGPHPRPDR